MTFRGKLILFQVAVIVLLGSVIALISVDYYHRTLPLQLSGVETKAKLCLNNLASTVDVGIAAHDLDLLKESFQKCNLGQGRARDPDLRFLAVLDHHGTILASIGQVPDRLSPPTRKASPVVEQRAGAYRSGALVEIEGRILGSVWAEYSTERVEAGKRFFTFFAIAGLIFSLLSTIVSVLFAFHMVRPLREMIAFVHKVATGDLQTKLHVKASDELAILAQDLNTMTEQLAISHEQMVQASKMAAVGQLAGGVAHEINNPLGVILGYAQSVIKRLKEEDPVRAPLHAIERETLRCKRLVADLLSFSRKSKGERKRVNITELITSTRSLIEHQARAQNIEIVLEGDPDPPEVVGDFNQLQQVLVNLFTNAIDAMPDGGSLRFVVIRAERGRAAISIEDSGSGISPEVREHIFEPFFTTKEVGKGTGLGLSLVYEIIAQHGGEITCRSEVGKGTCFTMTLPSENDSL